MKRFIVGYLSFFDNQLNLHDVSATSDVEAVKGVLQGKGWEKFEHLNTLEELCQFAFNCDAAVNAIEIK